MPNVLVRDVSDSVLMKLKSKAAASGRSLQAEVVSILNEAVKTKRLKQMSDLETARRIREMLSSDNQTDSADLLREDRWSR